MGCGTLTRGSTIQECDELIPSGTRARLILINFDDVGRIYETEDGVITSIELNGTAYLFTGFKDNVKKSEESVRSSQSKKRFIHRAGMVIYEVDQLQKLNIKDIAKGRFMAIVESKGETNDSIELLGRECGLQIEAGVIRSAHDTQGVFVINLSTPDNGVEWEYKLPQTFGGSYQDGLDLIDDLIEFRIFDDHFVDAFE